MCPPPSPRPPGSAPTDRLFSPPTPGNPDRGPPSASRTATPPAGRPPGEAGPGTRAEGARRGAPGLQRLTGRREGGGGNRSAWFPGSRKSWQPRVPHSSARPGAASFPPAPFKASLESSYGHVFSSASERLCPLHFKFASVAFGRVPN